MRLKPADVAIWYDVDTALAAPPFSGYWSWATPGCLSHLAFACRSSLIEQLTRSILLCRGGINAFD